MGAYLVDTDTEMARFMVTAVDGGDDRVAWEGSRRQECRGVKSEELCVSLTALEGGDDTVAWSTWRGREH